MCPPAGAVPGRWDRAAAPWVRGSLRQATCRYPWSAARASESNGLAGTLAQLPRPHLARLRRPEGPPDPLRRDAVGAGVNFSVFARHATAVSLVLFAPGEEQPSAEFPLDPRYNRTGDVWHAFLRGLDPAVTWAWRAERTVEPGAPWHRYGKSLLLDPYARAVAGAAELGRAAQPWRGDAVGGRPGAARRRRGEGVRLGIRPADRPPPRRLGHLRAPRAELHAARLVGRRAPGDVPRARREDPVPRRPRRHGGRADAGDRVRGERQRPGGTRSPGERLRNLWGYHPISFFAPARPTARAPSRARSSTSSRRW